MKKAFPSAGRLSEGPQDGYFNARLNRTFTARLKGTALVALLLLILADGCAMQPPTNPNSFSGPHLVVTMSVQGSTELGGYGINPSYYYFFVINYAYKPPNQTQATPAGIKGAPGPIAIFQPIGGSNGFVASSDGSTNGYTDFVEYNESLTTGNGYGLWHFVHNNPNVPEEVQPAWYGQPAIYTVPTSTSLQFTIYLTQLVQNYNREHGLNPSPAAVLAQAQQIEYLQVNFIATNTIAPSPTAKETDALGYGPNSNYLILDLGHSPTPGGELDNGNAPASLLEQPNDVYNYPSGTIGGGDPSLDLTGWSIQYFAN